MWEGNCACTSGLTNDCETSTLTFNGYGNSCIEWFWGWFWHGWRCTEGTKWDWSKTHVLVNLSTVCKAREPKQHRGVSFTFHKHSYRNNRLPAICENRPREPTTRSPFRDIFVHFSQRSRNPIVRSTSRQMLRAMFIHRQLHLKKNLQEQNCFRIRNWERATRVEKQTKKTLK